MPGRKFIFSLFLLCFVSFAYALEIPSEWLGVKSLATPGKTAEEIKGLDFEEGLSEKEYIDTLVSNGEAAVKSDKKLIMDFLSKSESVAQIFYVYTPERFCSELNTKKLSILSYMRFIKRQLLNFAIDFNDSADYRKAVTESKNGVVDVFHCSSSIIAKQTGLSLYLSHQYLLSKASKKNEILPNDKKITKKDFIEGMKQGHIINFWETYPNLTEISKSIEIGKSGFPFVEKLTKDFKDKLFDSHETLTWLIRLTQIHIQSIENLPNVEKMTIPYPADLPAPFDSRPMLKKVATFKKVAEMEKFLVENKNIMGKLLFFMQDSNLKEGTKTFIGKVNERIQKDKKSHVWD